MGRFIHIVFSILFLTGIACGQDIELGKEYFKKEEYTKAQHHFEQALKKKAWPKDVYPEYLQTLFQLKEYSTADKYFKKLLKTEDDNTIFQLDYLVFLRNSKSKDFEKVQDKTIKELIEKDEKFPAALSYLQTKSEYDLEERFVQFYRKYTGRKTAYYRELADVKKAQNKSSEMAEELLLGFLSDDEPIENLKNLLQNYLTEPADFEHFRTLLLKISQEDPQNATASELLIWIFLQERDFTGAFNHARALDRRMRSQGDRQREIADVALENKSYEAAIKIYESLLKDYPNTTAFFYARGKLITAREQKIKSVFPVNKIELEMLIKDYRLLIEETARSGSTNTYKYQGDMAMLYGFYLGKLDSAIIILNEALKKSSFDKRFQAQARLNLGDLYLLDNQPWESTLLYSQVEAMEKDQLLGHEAKLRNAKLLYYQGDFELAQEQMDVLKLATSREISNDAIQLSILIQDNIQEDTTGYALKKYAAIELLIFQNKWEEAQKNLQELYTEYRAASLKDDILFMEAKIFRQYGQFEKSISKFQELLDKHGEDILADDASYQIAQLYDYQLRNKEKAMEYYQQIFDKFPASIFAVESRKRFRELRGDKLN